jgi:tetratricopeptide (TPR) repeat protein
MLLGHAEEPMKRAITILLLFLTIFCHLHAGDRMLVEPALISPDTAENRQMVGDILKRASVLASRRYEPYFTVQYGVATGPSDYTIEVIASFDGTAAGVFKIIRGTEEQTVSYLDIFADENIGFIASIYASLWNTFADGFAGRQAPYPDLVDVLPAEIVLGSVPGLVPAQVNSMSAVSAAVKSNGNVLLAFGSTVAEMDSRMRFVGVIGRELMDKGIYTFAGGVYVTPADTAYLKPSMGRQVHRIVDGSNVFQPVNLGFDPFGSFTVLHDGTIVAFDTTTQKTFTVDDTGRTEINLKTGPSSYIWHLGTGPDGNIWSWDLAERRIKIHTKDGVLIDAILPITSATEYLAPTSMLIYPDGSFVLFVQGPAGSELRRYGRDGVLIWRMTELETPRSEMLPNNVAMAFDRERGLLYLLDTFNRRVLRFLDTEWTSSRGIDDGDARPFIDLNTRLRHDPEDLRTLRAKAELYTERGAVELAIAGWKELLAVDPYDFDAEDSLALLQVEILEQQATTETERTILLLEQYGPASAQMQYMSTLRVYEQILNMSPENESMRGAMEGLMRAYQERSTAPVRRSRPARVAALSLENLFPSLMLSYRDRPAGTVTLANTTGAVIEDIRATLFIRKYMDFPAESPLLERLDPDERADLPLFALLNENVLSLQEDLPIQVQVAISYSVAGEEHGITQTPAITLYRNTALSWDDSGKLASFIMPNEGIITGFAHRVLSNLDTQYTGLPERLVRAAKLCDAVGTYGIEYIEDPDSPFSAILGKEQVIDTVRFPRTTLHIRSGDCDDSTALLGSLFESSGISTAIMTSPGHVFLAFDTAEPTENHWLFQADGFTSIRHNGTIWLPVETTTLQKGFLESWRIASGLVLGNPDEIEFLPVHLERNLYPPLPLPESVLTVVEPQRDEIERLLSVTMEETIALLYGTGLERLRMSLGEATGRRELKIRNQLGVLHARFGEMQKAETVFEENLAEDPEYTASYLNLANLQVQGQRIGEATETLKRGLEQNPSSPTLNLLIARIFHADGDHQRARDHFAALREQSPSLAERFAYLGEGAGQGAETARRAGVDWMDILIWDEGAE